MRTVLLGDLINIRSGKTRPNGAGAFPVYGGNGVFDSAPYPNVNEPSVVVGRVGAYCGSVYLEHEPFWLSDNALGITAKNENSLEYIYYLLSSLNLNNKSVGGAQPLLTQSILNSVSVAVPGVNIQKKIADILGVLDEKIELNRKINETLERMSEALFRHYFINNPESGKWKESVLGDYVELVNGASYKSIELQPSLNALVTLKNIERRGGFSRRGYKEYTGKFKESQIVQDGDLVVAHTDLTQKAEVAGYPALVDGADQYDKIAISMDLVKIVPRDNQLSSSVVYFLLKTREFQNYKMGYISGSTVLHLNKRCVQDYKIALPDNINGLRKISSEFDCLMEQIKINNQQIHTLANFRDTLLPRLINGKVKI